MTTKDYQRKSGLSIFLSFFKPHRKLFALDLSCALLVSLIDLCYPIVSRTAMHKLLPEHAFQTFFLVMGVVVAAYILRSFLYFIIGYVSPLTWQTIGAAYLSSFFFDFCHGLCTFLVLWALGDPWVRKLERIKLKFGLTAEERNYVLPPSTFEIARENYE